MKNKKSIYVLLPLVLIIWGAIAYQFFSFTNDEVPVDVTNDFTGKPIPIKSKDTFSIKISKRDPFLGKMVNDEVSNVVKRRPSSTAKIKEEIIWPHIKYKGIVADNKDKVKVYMLIIDGKTHLMKKGEEAENVFLKDGDRDAVYVKYQGNIKVLIIQ